jgi:sugar lactone lactonase YvrE
MLVIVGRVPMPRSVERHDEGAMVAEQVTDAVAYHGEGPVWSERWGGLRWVDMLAGDVLSLAADGSVKRRHVASVVAALRPRRVGGAVLGIERGFALEDTGGTITRLSEVWTDERLRMNEGACDPDGRFYCGSMAYDKQPGAATLYRLEPDSSVHVVLANVTVSNGLDWSPDGSLAYYNDTDTGRVDVFDYERDAGLSDRRPFVETGARPDGLTVDAEGGVWVALSNAGAVRRYTAHGVLDDVVELPVTKVTACTFGGLGLDELFIATSREGLESSAEPAAGSLFRAIPGVTGLPAREFAG